MPFKTNIKMCLLHMKGNQIPEGTGDNAIPIRQILYILKVFV